MSSQPDLKIALADAYEECRLRLGTEVTDAMAFPSYLLGNRPSRYVAARKLVHIIGAADLRPGARVLDFGCGSGILLPQLCGQGRIVQATDLYLQPARIVAARLGLSQVEFLDFDAWEQGVPDGSVETIIAANVLEHIGDRRRLLVAFTRKLTASGRLVVSGPTENFLYRFGRRIVGFSGHYHVANVYDVLSDVRVAGFRLAHLRQWPLPGCGCLYKIAAFHAGRH